MGQKDYAQNDYFKDKVRFSDVCNGILYRGQPVIQPEELQEMNPDIVYYDNKNTLHKLVPDKVMLWKNLCIGIVGIESQTNVDYHNCDDFSIFKTENRLLFETLACSGDKRKMKAFFKEKSREYEKNCFQKLKRLINL